MITELHIDDPTKTPVEWWPKVEAFQGKSLFTFQKKGLTVLWGPNGSGKSSLLKILAHLTHCHQGGSPLVTDDSIRDLKGRDGPLDGARILTDGKPVHFLDPGAEAGLVGGGAGFDWDFGAEGIQAMFARRNSSGEQTTIKTNRILQSSAELKEVPWKALRPEKYKDQKWGDATREATKFLTANIDEDGPPTILLDEPGRSLSIPRQAELWHILSQQERFQIIVATHSVFALYLLGSTYIDVQPGYLQESRKEFDVVAETAILVKKLQNQMAATEEASP